ncbi:unnamed protein product [Calicophoron daubneyi]|uniref:Uncharacterized protein n=1 Tax=Calicophoron daubneyi TaxID=300641 RepID=A0AAV2T9C3_CALDB
MPMDSRHSWSAGLPVLQTACQISQHIRLALQALCCLQTPTMYSWFVRNRHPYFKAGSSLRACRTPVNILELSACAWIPLRKLQCAHIHSTIDQPQDNFASEEDLHITTLTHKTIQLITSNAVNPHVELRPERVESVRQGQFYDLFIPCPWTVHSK